MLPFLTDEQTEAVEAFSRFCRDQVRPVVQRYKHELDLPKDVVLELLRKVHSFGLGNGRVPTEDGGMGLNAVTNGAVLEAGIRHGDGFASYAFLNENVSMVLSRFASDEIKSRYLAPLVAGERIAAGAITEPSGGSDVSAVATRAVRTAHGYKITGRKVWISNGQHADFVTVLARDSETGQLDLYLVDQKEHGFAIEPLVTMGSISTAELVFDGAEIPASHRLGKPGKGFGAVLAAFQEARAYVGIVANGIALAAQDAALEYAATRTQFGGPIAGKQLVQALLADNQVDIDAARLLCYRALYLSDRGLPCGTEASIAKLFASEAGGRVVDRALQVHGGYGTHPDYPVEKLYRRMRIFRIIEGTSEIQRLVIGKALTGIAAF
jgi:alkylation response protein AidB-like acyl-CoA dehydrogenase